MQAKLTEFITRYADQEISKENLEKAMEDEYLFLSFNKAQWISFINGLRDKELEYQALVMSFLICDDMISILFKKHSFKELIYNEWISIYENKDNSIYVRKGIQIIAERMCAKGTWMRNDNVSTGCGLMLTGYFPFTIGAVVSWLGVTNLTVLTILNTATIGYSCMGIGFVSKGTFDLISNKVVEYDKIEREVESNQGKRCCGLW